MLLLLTVVLNWRLHWWSLAAVVLVVVGVCPLGILGMADSSFPHRLLVLSGSAGLNWLLLGSAVADRAVWGSVLLGTVLPQRLLLGCWLVRWNAKDSPSPVLQGRD